MKNKSIKQLILLLVSLFLFSILTWTPNVQAAKTFQDVDSSSSHYEAIHYLNSLHVYDYKIENKFYENNSITRNEVAKIIHTLYKDRFEKVRDYNENPFVDVIPSNPYFDSIIWAYEVKIFDGDEGHFKGEEQLKRAQLAKILVNTFDLQSAESSLPFKDISKDHWAYDYIHTLYVNGITKGSNGNYMPDNDVTNGQFASFIYRTIQVTGFDEDEIDEEEQRVEEEPIVEEEPAIEENKRQQASSKVLATYESEYDFVWNQIGKNELLELEGVNENNEVVGFYSAIEGKELFGITIGKSDEDDVIALYGDELKSIFKNNTNYILITDDGHSTYKIDGKFVTFFFDIFKDKTVRSILYIDEEYELKKEGFYGDHRVESRQEGFENLMVELMNQARVAEGLKPLKAAQQYRETARKHSIDMVENNFFSHTGSDGSSVTERMLADGLDFTVGQGENLAAGTYNTIFAHEALMNSKGHRANILFEQFTHAFTGVAFDGTRPYWTVNFYIKR